MPQARYLHGLLSRGRTALESLLPGFTGPIMAAGAHGGDAQQDFEWIIDGSPLPRVQSGMKVLSSSRPFLERHTRAQVAELAGVEFHTGGAVTGLIGTPDGQAVSGVRTDAGDLIGADLVVDASGRGSRIRQRLAEIGGPVVRAQEFEIGLAYSSRRFKLDGQDLGAPLGTLNAARPGRRAWRWPRYRRCSCATCSTRAPKT